MGKFVSRRPDGTIWSRNAVQQFDGQEFLPDDSPELLALELGDARASKVVEIDAAFDAKLAAGMPYSPHNLDVDDGSQQKLQALFSRAIAVEQGVPTVTWPSGGVIWRFRDNTMVALSVSDAITMCQQAFDYVSLQFYRRSAFKDAVAAAADQAALAAITVTFP